MARSQQNRPFKYGEMDRREFIVQDTEVSLVAINNTSGNPIYLGRAKVGTPLSAEMWQIRKITYDSTLGVTRVEWPQNSLNAASTEFEFVWSTATALSITNVSQANPAVVTVAAIGTLQNGDKIAIQDVAGMTEVNFDGSNLYTVANIVGNTFELLGIDSTAFTAYTGGGTVTFGNVLELTYS
jgi:hypothetical protein